MLAGTRSNVHNIVCRTHRILIMFHDNDRIAKITQMLQCSEQFVIIPLVQADTWLVQNISYPHQAGTDLCRKTDSLRFSSGQCSGSTGKRQVIQTYIHQKLNSCLDLF